MYYQIKLRVWGTKENEIKKDSIISDLKIYTEGFSISGKIVTMSLGDFELESLILFIQEVSKSLDLGWEDFFYKEITVYCINLKIRKGLRSGNTTNYIDDDGLKRKTIKTYLFNSWRKSIRSFKR